MDDAGFVLTSYGLTLGAVVVYVIVLLRRARDYPEDGFLRAGPLELDLVKRKAWVMGEAVELLNKEFRLLEFLVERPGRVFSREQLLDGVWGSEIYIDERTVDVHVGRLRKAINIGNRPDIIRTVRSAGYALDAGLTTREICETFAQCGWYRGWPHVEDALEIAKEVFAERAK